LRANSQLNRDLVARLGRRVGGDDLVRAGEDHPLRQAPLHLPRLQVGDHHHPLPHQHRRIGIALPQPGEDLPVAPLTQIHQAADQLVRPLDQPRLAHHTHAQVELVELVDGHLRRH
jgi:hypothetical protein